LQVYALAALDSLIDLAERAAGKPLTALHQRASAISNESSDSEALSRLMLDLRGLFEDMPQLAAQVAASIDAQSASARPSLRALLGLYTGANTRFLNFYGPPGTIATVPYQAVIQGGDPNVAAAAPDVSGKVVFVGYSDLFDPGQPDRFYTVFTRSDGVDLSGVEIAATAFANLLRDESIEPVSAVATVAILFGFGALMGMLIYLAPAMLAVPLSLVLTAVYAVAALQLFKQSQLWLPLATPILTQLPLALLVGLLGQYRLERQRAQHISEAIRLYVPEEVSRELTALGVKPDLINKVTYSTCLATDMAGFSTIAEAMKPGELAQFLNEYFEVLAQALRLHGVMVTEFRADAIMCAWTGVPSDVAVRRLPILAALEANRAIARFNLQRGLSGTLRVGLADGEVFVGHAGGGGHFVYSIVGDCANTASRIEGLNKHLSTQILATGTVAQDLDEFLFRRLGHFRFVGKLEALPIVEIVTLRASATAAEFERCEQFAAALAQFELGHWVEAALRFENVLLNNPQDGPAKFLHERCRTYLSGGDVPENPAVIIMSVK
jgi:adenylate cyclase